MVFPDCTCQFTSRYCKEAKLRQTVTGDFFCQPRTSSTVVGHCESKGRALNTKVLLLLPPAAQQVKLEQKQNNR